MAALDTIEAAVFHRILTSGEIKGGSTIVDAPCGKGTLAAALQAKDFRVFGLDIDPGARELLGSAFRHADLNGPLPLPDRSSDLVISVEGIEHLENPHSFLREVNRILRDEGLLILTTPNVVSLRSRVRFLGSGFFHKDSRPLNEAGRHPLHHIGLRTFPQLRYDLHTLGFRLEEVSSTHTKPISYLYSFFAPWMWLYTLIAFRKEKDKDQRRRNKEIFQTLYSRSVLFGENLLLVARKREIRV